MSISVRQKKPRRGRPATGHDPKFTFRLPEPLMRDVDAWAVAQADPLNRSEAVRELLRQGLAARSSQKSRRKSEA